MKVGKREKENKECEIFPEENGRKKMKKLSLRQKGKILRENAIEIQKVRGEETSGENINEWENKKKRERRGGERKNNREIEWKMKQNLKKNW